METRIYHDSSATRGGRLIDLLPPCWGTRGALLSNWGNELAVIDLAWVLPAILPSQYSTVPRFYPDVATDQHVSEYNRHILHPYPMWH